MPGGGLPTSPGSPGHRWYRGSRGHLPVCPWAVAARTSRTRSERGCKGFAIFGQRAGARLDPAPEGELLSPAAVTPALCTQDNGHLYWLQEDKMAPSTMATGLLSPLGGGTTPLAQAPAPHSTRRPPAPGPQGQRTGTFLCPGLGTTPRVGWWMEGETDT